MDVWDERLAVAGCHLTPARRAVIAALRGARAPLAPQEILPIARPYHQGLGLATVYRTLHLLAERGLVCRVLRENGCGYCLSPAHEESDRVVCTSCGREQDYPGLEVVRRLIRQAEVDTGYVVSGHLLLLRGLCPDCASRTEGAALRAGAEGAAP